MSASGPTSSAGGRSYAADARRQPDRLLGEALAISPGLADRLSALDRIELEVWAEIAGLLSSRRPRDKRTILALLADGLMLVPERPALRETVHGSLRTLTARSSRLTTAYLVMWRSLGPWIEAGDFVEIDGRARELARDVDLGATFMDYAPAILARRDMDFLRAWHEGGVNLASGEWWASRGFLESVGKAAHWLHKDDLPVLQELGSRVAERSRHAVKGLFSALPALLASMRVAQLVEWVDLGLSITRREDDLVLYMSYGSKRSQEAVETLCRETSFSAFRPRVALLLEAFLGRPASLRSMFDLLNPGTVPPDVPAFSDGEALYVRPALGCVGAAPFSLYKLVALHAAAHDRFGTFDDLGMQQALRPRVEGLVAEGIPGGPLGSLDELDRFLLGVAEDSRIDAALFRTLPGLRRDAEIVMKETYGHVASRFAAHGGGGAGGRGPGETTPGAPVSAAAIRAQVAAGPFGVAVLDDQELAHAIDEVMAPVRAEGAEPSRAIEAAGGLRRLLETRVPGGVAALEQGERNTGREGEDPPEVPYPPFHDHLFLGLKVAALQQRAGGEGALVPGTPVDVPASLHPSEVITGLEITVRDRQQEAELLILDDEEDEEDGDGCFDTFTYDEWDATVSDYRSRWCTVRRRLLAGGDPAFVDETVERYRGEVLLIRRQFERLRPDRIRRFFRQEEGDELDLDALIEALADRQAGAPMSDKVFIRRDKKQRDVACLFLLDMSDSTDQVVEGDRRVIDVEKEGLVLLSEAIRQLDDQYAIMGFSSKGRKLVDAYMIKDFEDDFDDSVSARIGAVAPLDYTRLGAAIRHGAECVAGRPAGARLLVLLSDGRPYDLGYGDMHYAMEDTKMALAEARRSGVNAFCITVDPKGPDYLEDLFGVNGYTVIQNVGHLPTKLPRIYRNLTV